MNSHLQQEGVYETIAENEKSDSNVGYRICLRSLNLGVRENDLRHLCDKFGEVIAANIVFWKYRDLDGSFSESNLSKGYGFVHFTTEASAKKAIYNLDQTELYGERITVGFARPKHHANIEYSSSKFQKTPTSTSKMRSGNRKIRGRGESGDRRKEERGVNERKHLQAKAKSVNRFILTGRKGNLQKKAKTVKKGKKRSARGDKIEELPNWRKINRKYQDTKPGGRSKSSYRGSQQLGSMREGWRADRSYDFSRNWMDINSDATPNDSFNY